MNAEQALSILAALGDCGVGVSIDGGWGVDALLGRQTREHSDLDLVVELNDVSKIENGLAPLGFTLAENELPVRFVMRDGGGSQLDFHTVTYESDGGGIQQLPGGDSFRYPPDGFTTGRIGGKPVRCISAEVQLLSHLGYEPTEKDISDVSLLCREFGLEPPTSYQKFEL